jgi:hypothetical protein
MIEMPMAEDHCIVGNGLNPRRVDGRLGSPGRYPPRHRLGCTAPSRFDRRSGWHWRSGTGFYEDRHASFIAVFRRIEPHDDGTRMLLLSHSRRALCRIGRRVGEGEQSDSRGPNDYRRSPSRTIESSGWTMPECLGDVGRGKREHVMTSLAGVGQRGTKRVLFGADLAVAFAQTASRGLAVRGLVS